MLINYSRKKKKNYSVAGCLFFSLIRGVIFILFTNGSTLIKSIAYSQFFDVHLISYITHPVGKKKKKAISKENIN